MLLAIVLLLTAWASAQEPSFEVASVKVKEGASAMGGHGLLPSGQVRFESAPLRLLLIEAFGVPMQEGDMRFAWAPDVEGLRDRPFFEVDAKAAPGSDARAMLRTLLRERFGLRYHREVRQVPVYALTVKEPGTLGPWLTPTAHNCREYIAQGGRRTSADAPTLGEVNICWPGRVLRGGESVEVSAGTIQDLIHTVALSGVRGDRPVIDDTGLVGNFLWQVTGKWGLPGAIFASFEDELGLKLERRTGPWEVIVIDAIQMPTPN